MKIYIVLGHVFVEFEIDATWNCKAFTNKENAQKLKNQLNSELKKLRKSMEKEGFIFKWEDKCKKELKKYFNDGRASIEYFEDFYIEEIELE